MDSAPAREGRAGVESLSPDTLTAPSDQLIHTKATISQKNSPRLT